MLQVKVVSGAISTNGGDYSIEERLNAALCELQDYCYPIKSVSLYPVGKDPVVLGGIGMIVYDDDPNESL